MAFLLNNIFKKILTKKQLLFLIGVPLLFWVLTTIGKLYIYQYDWFYRSNFHVFNANLLEVIFLVLGLTCTIFYIHFFLGKEKTKILLLGFLILIPILFNSIERATQEGAVDEGNTLYQAALVENTDLDAWYRSSYRVTGVIEGNLFTIINATQSPPHPGLMIQSLGYHKAVHWLISLLLILTLHFVINKFFITQKKILRIYLLRSFF